MRTAPVGYVNPLHLTNAGLAYWGIVLRDQNTHHVHEAIDDSVARLLRRTSYGPSGKSWA
jgi:hypothetical protein